MQQPAPDNAATQIDVDRLASNPLEQRNVAARISGNFQAVWRDHRNELGQLLVRWAFAALIGIYIISAGVTGGFDSPALFAPLVVYLLGLGYAFGLVLHLVITCRVSPVRRSLGIFLDIALLSLFMHFGDAVTAPFFIVYLWVTLANGFRFGQSVLIGTAALSLVCFSAVIATTPYWQANLNLASGLAAALLLLPAYVYRLLKHLNAARAQAEAANESKGRFLATISHEIRTPLNAIIGLTDILRLSQVNPDQRQIIRSIGVSAGSLVDLMGGVLDFSKIESGKVDVSAEAFSLYDLLSELEAIIAPQAQKKALGLSISVAAGCNPNLIGDFRHIREVITNLAGNAVKYTDEGHVSLTASVFAADNPGKDDSITLVLSVSDTGPGIAPEHQEQIFDSFSQPDIATRDDRGGVGLGLAICKRLVGLLGGTINLESNLGQGAVFTVALPLRAAAPAPVSTRASIQDGQILVLGSAVEFVQNLVEICDPKAVGGVVSDFPDLYREASSAIQRGISRPVLIVPESADLLVEDMSNELLSLRQGLSDIPLIIWLTNQTDGAPVDQAPPYPFIDMVVQAANTEEISRAIEYVSARCAALDEDRVPQSAVSLNILVAEDNRVNRTVASRLLEALGHRAMVVPNGESALEALENTSFDLVFMDVNMPVMDGLEATKMQRVVEMGAAQTPIIAVTADATVQTVERCLEAGMDDVVHKPISLASLAAAIDKLLTARPEIAADKQALSGADAVVTTHPRFTDARPALLDMAKIDELRALDQTGEFLATVASEFLEDAQGLVTKLWQAAVDGSIGEFRDANHALRSCSANVGAKRLFTACDNIKGIEKSALQQSGKVFAKDLQKSFDLTAHEFGLVTGAVSADAKLESGEQ